MKKIIFAIAALIALEGLALATNGVPGGTFSFKPSNNVSVFYDTSGQLYLVNTKHLSGDRVYSSTNNTSTIWFKPLAIGSAVTAAESVTVGMSDYSGWSSQ